MISYDNARNKKGQLSTRKTDDRQTSSPAELNKLGFNHTGVKQVDVNKAVELCSRGQFVILGGVDNFVEPVSLACRACNQVEERSVLALLIDTHCKHCSNSL